MFLNYLEEENKERFLKLCVYAALANDTFEKKEKEMIYAYCREMSISEYIPDICDNFEDVLNDISKNTNNIEKNIILLEILGLVKSDGVYDDKEREFMEKLAEGIKVKEDMLERTNSLLDIYMDICKDLYTLIME